MGLLAFIFTSFLIVSSSFAAQTNCRLNAVIMTQPENSMALMLADKPPTKRQFVKLLQVDSRFVKKAQQAAKESGYNLVLQNMDFFFGSGKVPKGAFFRIHNSDMSVRSNVVFFADKQSFELLLEAIKRGELIDGRFFKSDEELLSSNPQASIDFDFTTSSLTTQDETSKMTAITEISGQMLVQQKAKLIAQLNKMIKAKVLPAYGHGDYTSMIVGSMVSSTTLEVPVFESAVIEALTKLPACK